MKTLEAQGFFFNFEIIIKVLVSSFRFILIPMWWVYGYPKSKCQACKEDAIIKDAERMQGGCKIVRNVNVQA